MGDSGSRTRKRVLIADDSRSNRELLRVHLERMGDFNVVEAIDGLEAIRCAKRRRPDVILMDVHMPRMNGYEATRELRASTNGVASVPVIAITAGCFSGEIERCSRAGASDYIASPLTNLELLRSKVVFWSALGHDESVCPPTVPSPTTGGNGRA